MARLIAAAGVGILAAASVAAPALAEGTASAGKDNPAGALALLGLVPLLPPVLAVLFPQTTRTCAQRLRERFWACLGWGALWVVLAGIVAGVLTKGGGPGGVLAIAVASVTGLGALAGLTGLLLMLGDWSLRRWSMETLGPLSVMLGGALWAVGSVIPVAGWGLGGLSLVAGLGALMQGLLSRQHPEVAPVAEAPDDGSDTTTDEVSEG